ncbi:hypothetical protein HDU92_009019 [Lobulomyces angularis]|nr:hypothetical protein HDU92_009019 [Lobulomyces angularis]
MLNIRQSTNRSDPIPLWKSLLSSPEFYLITSICCSILTPWLFLRKIKIESKRLSSKAILLTFSNSRKTFCGSAVAISHSPFGEYHAFATIKTPKKKGYRIIVAKAGDWTTDLIEHPRNEIWIKGVPTAGMMRVEKLFKRVLYVCTGSGIGPILPHILRKHPEKSKLLWICSEPEATFGQELVNEIKSNAGLDAVIHNTRTQGRLNLVKTSISMYQEINAETILVVSNPAFTAQLSYGCNARGIRCLGVIFDS